ncbi:MAG: CapA family protein [Bacteroidales bacterium]|nr:CapA family protein [Bacteroidales bacterium]
MSKNSHTINILITGDFCPNKRVQDLILAARYGDVYNDFYPNLLNNDLNITNLECPLINIENPIDKTGPTIRANEKCIEILKYGNFNLVTLSNNHIMDHGKPGLVSTIHLCQENQIECLGAGSNIEEASEIWYKKIKNSRIAILNFSEMEFSTAEEFLPGSNPLDPIKNFYSIRLAKENADYVIIIIHGGHEGYQLPSPRMVKTYRYFIDCGADLVVGHHPHCFSGYEKYKDKMIHYSLGNFIFDDELSINQSWNFGYAIKVIINNSKVFSEIIPYKQCNGIPGVFMLNENERIKFENEIQNHSKIIHSEYMLKERWKEHIKKLKNEYILQFECFDFWLYEALRSRRYIPSPLSKRKRLRLLNMLRCQSHRDIAIESLK